jgi:hypothetical protein
MAKSKVTVVATPDRVLARIERESDGSGRALYETLDLSIAEADTLAHAILLQLEPYSDE